MPLKPRDRWIWVYHAPPAESVVSWGGRRHHGDEALTGWIREYRPDFVMSGHVHQSPFVDGGSWADRIGGTWVFNTGQQIGPTPANIALHLTHGEAIWTSLDGCQILSLADAPVRPYAEDARDPGVVQSRGSARSSSGVTGRSSCWVRSEPRMRSTMPRWLSSSMNCRLRSAR
jgi:hypothetical protein